MNLHSKEKWHISDDGTPAQCHADVRVCPRGSNGPHFDSEAEVYGFFKGAHEQNAMGSLRKVETINDDELYDASDDGVHEDYGPDEPVRFA